MRLGFWGEGKGGSWHSAREWNLLGRVGRRCDGGWLQIMDA